MNFDMYQVFVEHLVAVTQSRLGRLNTYRD